MSSWPTGLPLASTSTTVSPLLRPSVLVWRDPSTHWHIASHAALSVSLLRMRAESHGDKNIEVTPWQEVNQGVGATRNIRLMTPLEVRARSGHFS